MNIPETLVRVVLVLVIVRIATMAIHALCASVHTAMQYAAYKGSHDAARKAAEQRANAMNN